MSSRANQISRLNSLPDELVHKIFNFTPKYYRKTLASVNRRFFRLARTRERLLNVEIHLPPVGQDRPAFHLLPYGDEILACIRVLVRDEVKPINTIYFTIVECAEFEEGCEHDRCKLDYLPGRRLTSLLQISDITIYGAIGNLSCANISQIISTFNLKYLKRITLDFDRTFPGHSPLNDRKNAWKIRPEKQVEDIILIAPYPEIAAADWFSDWMNTFALNCFALIGCETIILGGEEDNIDSDLKDIFWIIDLDEDTTHSLIVDRSKSGRAKDLMDKYYHYDHQDFKPRFFYERHATNGGKVILYDCRELPKYSQ